MAITYNGSNPFLGQPVPFVKIGNDYTLDGSERIDRTTLTLRGELLACSRASLQSLRDALELAFKPRAEIVIDGLDTYQVENVVSLSFEDSPLFSKLPYTIVLQLKDDKQVIDKSVELSFDENIDQTLTITRTISAKGKEITTTSADAWNHVKNYVQTQCEKALPRPFSIDSRLYNYFLVSSQESMDRVNKTLNVTQTFKCEIYRNASAILRHTKVEAKPLGDEKMISVSGTIEYGRQNQLSTGMADYAAFKASLTNSAGQPVRNIKNERVEINELGGQISFSFEYKDGLEDANHDGYILEYKISFEDGPDTSLIRANISGTFKLVSDFTAAQRNALASTFNTRVINSNYLYDKVLALYYKFYTPPAGVILCVRPLNSRYSIGKNGTRIEFSASFDDRFQTGDFEIFNYSLSTKPSIKSISISPSLKGGYVFTDLGFLTKAEKEISVNSMICAEDLQFNQLDWATFKLLQHIDADKVGGSQTAISKGYSATNGGEYSSTTARVYDGAEFSL